MTRTAPRFACATDFEFSVRSGCPREHPPERPPLPARRRGRGQVGAEEDALGPICRIRPQPVGGEARRSCSA
jgi:hypothetical protein